jgi:hypothetical protein
MNLRQLEERVIEVCDRIKSQQKIEDSMIELKASFVDPKKAAGILAGQANALHGERALWIIGVDENAGTIEGITDKTELANWLPQVESQFDGPAPSLVFDKCVFYYDDKLVVGLLFDTDQAPYVVKNPRKGQQSADDKHIDFWIPVRVGKQTRTAKREHLLRILTPLESAPQCEVLSCELYEELQNVPGDILPNGNRGSGYSIVRRIQIKLFVSAKKAERVFIPFHTTTIALGVNREHAHVPYRVGRILGHANAIESGYVTTVDRAGVVEFHAVMPANSTIHNEGASAAEVVVRIGTPNAATITLPPIELRMQRPGPAAGAPTWSAVL